MPGHCIRARHGWARVVFSLWAPREGKERQEAEGARG